MKNNFNSPQNFRAGCEGDCSARVADEFLSSRAEAPWGSEKQGVSLKGPVVLLTLSYRFISAERAEICDNQGRF